MSRCPLILALALLTGCGVPSTPSTTSTASASSIPPTSSASAASPCGDGRDGSAVVATLGDIQVSEADVDAAIARLPARARRRYDDVGPRRLLAERVAEERALCLQGDLDDDLRAVAARAAEEAVAARRVDRAEAAASTDEAVRAWYEAHPETYRVDLRDVSHLIVATEDEARDLLREARAGADFADLALAHSLDQGSRQAGGRLGWVPRDKLDATWSEAAWALEPGRVSEPVQTEYGWHLILVHEDRDLQPLAEVAPGIERVLRDRAAAEARERALANRAVRFEGPLSAGPDSSTSSDSLRK